MYYFYAQLDENNICFGISQLLGEVKHSNMIPLTEQEYSVDLLGKKYVNSKFIEVTK